MLLEELQQKLLPIVQRCAVVAERSIRGIRFLFLTSLLSAGWLSFFLTQRWNLSLPAIVMWSFMLSLPSIFLGFFYLLMWQVMGLPKRLGKFLETTGCRARERCQTHAELGAKYQKGRFAFSDLLFLGKALHAAKVLTDECKGLSLFTGGTLLLLNPIFLVLVGFAIVTTSFLVSAAVITVLVYVW